MITEGLESFHVVRKVGEKHETLEFPVLRAGIAEQGLLHIRVGPEGLAERHGQSPCLDKRSMANPPGGCP